MPDFARIAIEAARLGTGLLGWDADRFWQATPVELLTALEGRLGIASGPQPMLSRDLAALREKLSDG